ncbi:MAG: FAD-binding oxidoreductase [Candidatus Sumerlaeaceae bacterium]|nr:FAD-binding oxidoreductase [Candidatus Sumerlaeaceae bacterium]
MTPNLLTNDEVIAGFRSFLPEARVLTRLIDLNSRAGDASIYRLVPRVVVIPETIREIQAILRYCREHNLYLTFRAAGTSLSGQAVTDGVLADVARHWKGLRILDGGRRVAVEPGVVGAHVNAFLARHGAKIGPDPASINACMMGGIAANNASGMCCGVAQNAYHTLASMKLVLADGYFLDTAMPDADDRLRRDRPAIAEGLLGIQRDIFAVPGLADRIRRKFSRKNTCGYSMNAFVDFDRPADILQHLLVGSEGTLGFIAEITLNTVPDLPLKATALVYFRDLADAGAAIAPLAAAGAAVLEIMDRAAMLSVADEMKYAFPVEGNCAALLVEFQDDDETRLESKLDEGSRILSRWPLLEPVLFTRDAARREALWHMRKGLFPSVGAMREMGTAVIIEDVCVDPARLAECMTDLQALFAKYDFPEAIIFGHAKDGNLHFVICTDFSQEVQKNRYAGLMAELMALIVDKYDGSLKAEHGTGRNVAPFVESEWGPELYEMMWRVKRLLDPDNVLNPGVVLNRDPHIHLKDLKVMPAVSPIVDKCIECGFCEPRCPSRDLTLTPRQRIALLREVERLKGLGDRSAAVNAAHLLDEYGYDGVDTCAGDGMCATACPVKIDTGALVKDLRAGRHGTVSRRVAALALRHFAVVSLGVRAALRFIQAGGRPALALARASAEIFYRLSGGQLARLPKGIPIPAPAPPLPKTRLNGGGGPDRQVVYFPSCLTRMMGAVPGERSPLGLAEAVVRTLELAGWHAVIPQRVAHECCGQPFHSKGFFETLQAAAEKTTACLYEATQGGRLPVICDTSPCSGEMREYDKYLTGENLRRWQALRIYDYCSFFAHEVLPLRETWPRTRRHAILHPTCTLMKQAKLPDLKAVAAAFAERVTVPVLAECCGFAGDRGYSHPELTLSATRPEAAEVRAAECGLADGFYSTCRTCEIGMTAGTGRVYSSIVYLVLEALEQAPR